MNRIDKTQCLNLFIGVVGIYVSYITSGIINQRIMKKKYFSANDNLKGQNFNSVLGFNFITTGIPWILGKLINYFTISQSQKTQIPYKNSIACAIIILISTFCYLNSIIYASFPIATLFKSCNILSVILVGVLCTRVTQKKLKLQSKKIYVGILVTLGLLLFKFTDPQAKQGAQKNTQLIGIGLLFISLIADGFLPDFQAQIKIKYKPKPMQMMVQNNKWVCIFSFILLLITNQITYLYQFYINHPDFLIQILIMGILSLLGQIFVYRMIKQFKQHIVPFIVTTRKISTSSISLIYYKHETSYGQLFSIILIYSIIIFEFISELRVQKHDQKAKINTEINISQLDSHQQQQSLRNFQQNDKIIIQMKTQQKLTGQKQQKIINQQKEIKPQKEITSEQN